VFPPIVENREELKKYVKFLSSESGSSTVLSEKLVDDVISNLGGCLLLYQDLLKHTNVADGLNKMKTIHKENLMSALDLQEGQLFSGVSLERYELLQAVARGEKIVNPASPAAKYLQAKHGDIQAFLGISPEGHLVFALPMTKQSLMQIEDNKLLSVYLLLMRYIRWLCLK